MSIVPEMGGNGQWRCNSIYINILQNDRLLRQIVSFGVQRLRAKASSNAAPAAIPAIAKPVRFIDLRISS